MADRLTRWEGRDENGPRAVLVKRDGLWPENYQEALRKLAKYEDAEERHLLRLPRPSEAALAEKVKALDTIHQMDQAEIVLLRRQIEALQP